MDDNARTYLFKPDGFFTYIVHIVLLSFSESNQINNVGPGSGLMNQYPTLGQVSHVYEQPQPVKELNKYASLKAVGKCAWMFMLSNQQKYKASVYCSWEAGYNPMDKSSHW